MSEQLTKAELLLAAKLLEDAAEQYSNHGCNDYFIENTPEHRAIVLAKTEHEGWEPEDINPDPDHLGRIITDDSGMMDYLAHRLRQAATGDAGEANAGEAAEGGE